MIHLEAVADAPRGSLPPPSDPATAAAVAEGKKLYADSIESLVRNEIQRTKIEMANEVIDAGRCVACSLPSGSALLGDGRVMCWGGGRVAGAHQKVKPPFRL